MSIWKYLSNQFDTATKKSDRKALILGSDHDSRLAAAQSGNPAVAALFTRFHPLYQAYSAAYSAWSAARGLREGGTASVSELLEELRGEKARRWDVQVQVHFDKGTPEHTAIFPDGRGPLQEGAMDARIAEVLSLHTRMVGYEPPLPAALLTEILTFHADLVTARNAQQGQQGDLAAASTALEAARAAMVEMMYGNLGALMDIHRANPGTVANYFELSLIRSYADDEEEEPPAPPTP